MSKIYMVETFVTHRVVYAIEASSEEEARNKVIPTCNQDDTIIEMTQNCVGEGIFSSRKVTEKEYLRVFDEENPERNKWSVESKLKIINR